MWCGECLGGTWNQRTQGVFGSSIFRPRTKALRVCWSVACLVVTLVITSSRFAQAEETSESVTSYPELQQLAKERAQAEYIPPPQVPESLSGLNYDGMRMIAFRADRAVHLQGQQPFRLEFFHKGYVQQSDVSVNLIRDGAVVPIKFTKKNFDYRGDIANLEIPDDLGFAGFRVVGHFPGRRDVEEMLTFLGASYFRGRAEKHVYGSSARGLAIDSGLNKPEEFPAFREFWVFDSKSDTTPRTFRVLALLDSPSVVGAYDFQMAPGRERMDLDVTATLYFRRVPEKVGLAPLTSMWIWGDGLPGPEGDSRPEVHDADGLLVQGGDGRWFWRALNHQTYPSLVNLGHPDFKGYGVIQRDTDPDHYDDQEARYHARPSIWIQPKEGWPAGSLELLELDARHEGIDNIAAWWVPRDPPRIGEPMQYSYQLSFMSADLIEEDVARAVAHRIDRLEDGQIRLEIDFRGPALAQRSSGSPPDVQLTTIRATVDQHACRQQSDGTWTAEIVITPTSTDPFELQATLADQGKPISEQWSILCPLKPPHLQLPPWRLKELEQVPQLDQEEVNP